MSEDVHIAVNKRRLLIQAVIYSVLGLGAFAGTFLVAENADINPWLVKAPGIVALIFGLLAGGAKARKRADNQAGLHFTKEGINDQSSDISIGLVEWRDIKSIDSEASRKAELFIVEVRKNETYLKKAKNSAIERLLRQNIRNYGTPVVIDPRDLNCSLNELLDIASERFKK